MPALRIRIACVEYLRRRIWPIFSLVQLVGILQPKVTVSHVAFLFSIDWDLARRHVPSLVLWWRSNNMLNPRPQILGNMHTGLTVTLGLHFNISVNLQR